MFKVVKEFLDKLRANTTREEFKEILKATEDDIKFNRVGFKKCTSQKEFISICEVSWNLIIKCKENQYEMRKV